MGVNAQTSVPAFTAGQVLTAAEMTEVNTGIPVFATTVTRDAAFGGTGEKVLAAGQTCYIEATSSYQTYNGSAWVSFGVSGLTLIKSQTIGTTVGSVTVSDAFSATYDDYKIVISGGVNSVDTALLMTLGATATGYYYRGFFGNYSTSTYNGDNAQNTTFWTVGLGSANTLSAEILVQQPFTAKNTTHLASAARTATNGLFIQYGGYLANTTSYTAFTVTPQSGTMTGGTIRVYGLQNS
jgi:hypothetical protein